MNEKNKTYFAPQLVIKSRVTDIDFYTMAFGAVELRRWSNDGGSVHVAEFSIDGAMFHLHEENLQKGAFSPEEHGGITTTIGLFVPDVDAVMDRAVSAVATVTSPAQDYDYGYRQGEIMDPCRHRWLIQMKI